MSTFRCALLAAGLLFAAACSDDDNGTGGGASSTQLKDLSPAELETECRAVQGDFDAVARGACMLDARDSENCQTAAAGCTERSGIDCDNIDASDVSDCTVTVGELESCLDQLAAFFAPISCSVGPSSMPPNCMQSVQAKCSIFGG